jgi:hypothetical protein
LKVRPYTFRVKPVSNRLRFFILCFILISFTSLRIAAQQVNPMFYKEIQLDPKKTYTLQSITREIQQQTGISFSYNAARINPDRKIRMKTDRITVAQLLSSIRKKAGIGYKIISKTHIIYVESGKKKIAGKKGHVRKSRPSSSNAQDNPETVMRPVGHDSTVGQQIVIIGDSSVMNYYFSGGGSSGGGYGGDVLVKYPVMIDATEDEEFEEEREYNISRNTSKGNVYGSAEAVTFLKSNVLFAAGILADETYYLNPTVRAGFDFLYGTVSYNVGPFPHWRFGIGGSAKVNDNWTLHVGINTGSSIFQNYNIQTFDTIVQPQPPDTFVPPVIIETNTPLVVKSKLTRFSVSAEWNLGRGFTLGGGLILNRMKTDYSSNGNPVTLNNFLPVGYDADSKYRTIKPPYLLGNTYNGNSSSNVKTWIGLQVSLMYRLSFFER